MGKRANTGPFDFPAKVEDPKVRARALALLKAKGVRLPTLAELAEPALIPKDVRAALGRIGPDDAHPLNLYRVHWFNDLKRTAQVSTPVHIELPETLTGVKARIVVALGALFPMIRAHKVLAAYACLAPRLVSGRFDPARQRAVWPSTGNSLNVDEYSSRSFVRCGNGRSWQTEFAGRV